VAGLKIMMAHRQVERAALFYEFSLEKHIPADHLLRSIDRFVDLQEIKRDLAPFYSNIGRPSIDPELMIRMLLIGYCFGIRSEYPTSRYQVRSPVRWQVSNSSPTTSGFASLDIRRNRSRTTETSPIIGAG
jgi:transposase